MPFVLEVCSREMLNEFSSVLLDVHDNWLLSCSIATLTSYAVHSKTGLLRFFCSLLAFYLKKCERMFVLSSPKLHVSLLQICFLHAELFWINTIVFQLFFGE